MKVLNQKFFSQPTFAVAKKLLGKYLVRRYRGKIISGMIVEVEVYDGPRDKASHASRGMTKRNKVMFGPAGYWYVYFTYGMHWMLNVVTGKKGYPAAILIRGVSTNTNYKLCHEILQKGLQIIGGPGRVTKYFKIDEKFNGKPANRRTGLWIEDRGIKIPPRDIQRSKRVGVEYAGSVWANKKYRFYIKSKSAHRLL